jgi:hypothetical protein
MTTATAPSRNVYGVIGSHIAARVARATRCATR